MSEIDDVCTKILLNLIGNTKDYAQLQRGIGAGSVRTAKRHVKHLKDKGLVEVERERRGIKFYYRIFLTKNGTEVAGKLSEETKLKE